MVRRTILGVMVLGLLIVGCASSSSSSGTGDSGIQGKVLIGPTCPVETIEHPCPDRPLAADLVVARVGGGTVATALSGNDGTFRVPLPPGAYTITVGHLGGVGLAKPMAVTVPAGRFVEVTVSVDSGIR
jgi:major membrane immunogen (membrane-anchored lipoprotein)